MKPTINIAGQCLHVHSTSQCKRSATKCMGYTCLDYTMHSFSSYPTPRRVYHTHTTQLIWRGGRNGHTPSASMWMHADANTAVLFQAISCIFRTRWRANIKERSEPAFLVNRPEFPFFFLFRTWYTGTVLNSDAPNSAKDIRLSSKSTPATARATRVASPRAGMPK